MDDARLSTAEEAYQAGDWTVAAREFLAATGGEAAGAGYAFHRAGNALMRLKRLDDAAAVYERALQDEEYEDTGAVACNLGTALAALGEHDRAAQSFRRAAADPAYAGRYKGLQGLGGALYEMGRIEESAEAYREAALDEGNPDPGKALNNLGLCFLKLGRPADAVAAYRAALERPEYRGKGRAAANLGMAYAALGEHDAAVVAFERARDEFGFTLGGAMESAYRTSSAAIGGDIAPAPGGPQVEGWSTGEIPMGSAEADLACDGADEVSRFFAMTDAEMKAADREARRRERLDSRQRKPVWVTVLTWAAAVVLVAGALVGAYLFGLGYPTQHMTVQGMLEAYRAGQTVESYWVAVPTRDVAKAMSSLPPAWESYDVVRVVRSARTSKADVTIVLEQGGTVAYEVSLAREGVGWKVNGITNSFNSLEGGL